MTMCVCVSAERKDQKESSQYSADTVSPELMQSPQVSCYFYVEPEPTNCDKR